MRYLPHTQKDIASMLKTVGVSSLDELFKQIPERCRLKKSIDLPEAMNEWELCRHMRYFSNMMATAPEYKIFIGAGCYEHHIPAVVSNLMNLQGFVTSYTPYQPEISQGTLQGLYEYQTMICEIFGMDVTNTSLYDGASALAEALLMAVRITGRKRVALSKSIHPHYREVVKTYLETPGFEISEIPFNETGKTDISCLSESENLAAVAVQSPNFFGCIEDLSIIAEVVHRDDIIFIVTFTEPLAYGIFKNPGSQDADIICGEGRSFGLSQYFGGMSLGIFASKMDYVRYMPGRIVGKTKDAEGKRGFVLTLATREQHIRREKATSNICTDQSLCALGAAQYLASLGKNGFRELAKINYNKSEYLKQKLRKSGFLLKFEGPTFNEFVIKYPNGFDSAYESLIERKIVAGLKIEDYYPDLERCCLLCVTETKTKDDIDNFVEELKSCLNP